MKNGEYAMVAHITLRDDFDAGTLRLLANESRDFNPMRRLLSLAPIYDGGMCIEANRNGELT